jgi:negative regulator of flagellin synthesis FlgM
MKIPGDTSVPSKINGVETKTSRVASASPVGRRAGGPPEAPPVVVEPESDVKLTGAARGMLALEQAVHAMPVVDEARVAEVKQRLQEGRYEVDPQRVADKLLRLEGDLRQGAPFSKNPLR